MYKDSIENNEEFWKKHGKRITWFKDYTKVRNYKYGKDETDIKWYEDGELNVCYNCVDRHLEKKGDDVAIIWQGNEEE
jgi:acetyl-CoA synthetase